MLKRLPPTQVSMPIDVLANYMAGAELSLMTWWLEDGQKYLVEQMAVMTQQLILRGVLVPLGRVANGASLTPSPQPLSPELKGEEL